MRLLVPPEKALLEINYAMRRGDAITEENIIPCSPEYFLADVKKWFKETSEVLEKIFEDYSDIRRFKSCLKRASNMPLYMGKEEKDVQEEYENGVKVLTDYCEKIRKLDALGYFDKKNEFHDKKKEVDKIKFLGWSHNTRPDSILPKLDRSAEVMEDGFRKERESRDRIVIEQRGGKDQFLYILERLIAIIAVDSAERLEIRFASIGITSSESEQGTAHKFLNRATVSGCFKKIEATSDCFVFFSPNLQNLKKYKRDFEKKISAQSETTESTEGVDERGATSFETIEYKRKNLVGYYDRNTNKCTKVKHGSAFLHVSKRGLRREDILFLGKLIRDGQGGIVAHGHLKDAMEKEDTDTNNSVLYRATTRLKQFANIDFIKNKRSEGYYLD